MSLLREMSISTEENKELYFLQVACSIMSGFGGAGAFSDGKYNITNEFWRYIVRAYRQAAGH